jgi:hypothetical protein
MNVLALPISPISPPLTLSFGERKSATWRAPSPCRASWEVLSVWQGWMATRAAAKSWCDFVSRSLGFFVWRGGKGTGGFGRFVSPLVRGRVTFVERTAREGRWLPTTSYLRPPRRARCPSSRRDILRRARLLQAPNDGRVTVFPSFFHNVSCTRCVSYISSIH